MSTASYGGLITFLEASPFVFIEVLGLDKIRYGLLMFSMSFGNVIDTSLCRRRRRFGARRSVRLAATLTLTGGLLIGTLAATVRT